MEKKLTPMQELINHIEKVQFIPKEVQIMFLERERKAIIDAYNKSGKKSTNIANNLIHASTGVKDTFYHEDVEGEKYFNETFNKQD